MTRRYGAKKRTKADKQAAALQFVVMSNRRDDEKVRALVASYGFTLPEAEAFVRRYAG